MPHAYDKLEVQGHELDQVTYAAFQVAQAHPKADNDWTIFQGCYTEANPSSGGTHGGGGAIDASPFNWRQRVRALRLAGFAAWHRPLDWDGNGGVEHIHAIQVGNAKLSLEAAAQIPQYVAYLNGLATPRADDSWHPFPKGGTPPVFQWDAFVAEGKRVAELKAAFGHERDAIHKAVANAQSDRQLKALHAQLREIRHMPAAFRWQAHLYTRQENVA